MLKFALQGGILVMSPGIYAGSCSVCSQQNLATAHQLLLNAETQHKYKTFK